MSSDANLIAVRYVRALFDMATENKQHDNLKKDLTALKAVLAKSEELQKFLVSPIVSRAEAEKAINAVLASIKACDLTKMFFSLLARRRRLELTSIVIEKYLARLAEMRNELVVHVVSATSLGKKQVEFLSDVLAGVTKKKVEMKLAENSELIGGVQIRIGSKMIDNSVSTKLSRLRLAFTKAA